MSAQKSTALISLMRYAKNTPVYEWKAVAKHLEPLFFTGMNLVDVVSIVLAAYEEALSECRFELGSPQYKARDLLLAPIKGYYAVERFGPRDLSAQYSVEQVYNSFLAQMLSDLRLARVDWCEEYQLTVVDA